MTVGFRAWESVRHSDDTMNKADGMMEKKSCSNCRLKSKRSRSIWNKSPSLFVKAILTLGDLGGRGGSACKLKWPRRSVATQEKHLKARNGLGSGKACAY